MKILFTGGGTGGHFYPIIAVVEQLERIVRERKLLPPELYYLAESPYDSALLFKHQIMFKKVAAGKLRRYFSVQNFFDGFKTVWGILKAIWILYQIYPDVVFSKGAYSSFPAVLAARLLRIPVFIHESDSVPGRVNLWASKFAYRIAVSFSEAAGDFPAAKVAWTGQPVRQALVKGDREEAGAFLKLEDGVPTILILGGSQGAELINDTVVRSLKDLLGFCQIIHQTGLENLTEVNDTSKVVLDSGSLKSRYQTFAYLNDEALSMAASVSSLVVSRAGSTIFEIAAWGLPSIIVPITESNGDHQRQNSYNYARSGAAIVIEEANLSPHIFIDEIKRLLANQTKLETMAKAAKSFFQPDAARKIADELLSIGLEHEN
jgi:UDP-N-acetylglucosamine--N-acetylmuramyl-(pentapeptide) pyrophosphoryl-undecaprenol N-acetylglucosamine transferase